MTSIRMELAQVQRFLGFLFCGKSCHQFRTWYFNHILPYLVMEESVSIYICLSVRSFVAFFFLSASALKLLNETL